MKNKINNEQADLDIIFCNNEILNFKIGQYVDLLKLNKIGIRRLGDGIQFINTKNRYASEIFSLKDIHFRNSFVSKLNELTKPKNLSVGQV